MAIPYPPDRSAVYSQEKDHRVAIASRVILEAIDSLPDWDTVSQRLADRLRLDLGNGRDRALVQDAFLTAELDLEWTNAIVYEDDHFRRPGGVNDPVPIAPEGLHEVADSVWSLGWPNPGHKPSRSIYECFRALDGRYRHCDVYWAMHKYLKGNRLRVIRRNWMLLKDVEALLADPTLTTLEREELERELERDLVDDYVAWLGRPVRKHLFSNGREADLYDRDRHLIIEARQTIATTSWLPTAWVKRCTTARLINSARVTGSQSCSPDVPARRLSDCSSSMTWGSSIGTATPSRRSSSSIDMAAPNSALEPLHGTRVSTN
ncbi:MAG: hypothetical protein ACOH2F_20420 [Cellulomonas sp.]